MEKRSFWHWLENAANLHWGWGMIAGVINAIWAAIQSLPGPVVFSFALFAAACGMWLLNQLRTWFTTKRLVESKPESIYDPPEPHFGCPLQTAGEDDLSWWHIPVWLEKKGESLITAYEHCRGKIVSLEGRFVQVSQLDLRCQSDNDVGDREFPLRLGEEPKLLPIARRSEIVDKETMACSAYFTDEGYLQHGIREPQLESGSYTFRVEIRHETLRWESNVYILSVPGPRMSNGHFILTVDSSLSNY